MPAQGIEGGGFYSKHIIPVIENTARECELTDRLRQAIKDYPQAQCVLVRRHGEQETQMQTNDWLWNGWAICTRRAAALLPIQLCHLLHAACVSRSFHGMHALAGGRCVLLGTWL